VRISTKSSYRDTLEHILVINLINVMFVVKCLVRMVPYRHTLGYIQVIHLMNVIYVEIKHFTTYITFTSFIPSMCSNVCL
jgi:hypothetical protein